MSTVAHTDPNLSGTEGYVLESPQGDLGRIDEVVVGNENEPVALDVVTNEGWHGLLRAEDVLVVDREYHWVVVPPDPELRTTTGEVRHARPRQPRPLRVPWRRLRRTSGTELPLWQAIAIELSSIALLVLAVVGLAFLVAWLVTGAAY